MDTDMIVHETRVQYDIDGEISKYKKLGLWHAEEMLIKFILIYVYIYIYEPHFLWKTNIYYIDEM